MPTPTPWQPPTPTPPPPPLPLAPPVNADLNGSLDIYLNLVGANVQGRLADQIRFGNMSIIAEENAREGDVRVEIEIFRHGNVSAGEQGYVREAQGSVTVARFALEGVELGVHPDFEVDDFWLQSGQQTWTWDSPEFGNVHPITPNSPSDSCHLTAAVTLRELSAHSMILTRRSNIEFVMPEGVEVLGARIRGRGAAELELQSGDPLAWRYVWFIDGREANRKLDDNFGALVRRNSLSLRPERHGENTDQLAEIDVQFYLSVQAGFDKLFDTQNIDVTVGGAALRGFSDSATVAHVFDPIEVEIDALVLNDADSLGSASIGINDIVIRETVPGILRSGRSIRIGIDGSVAVNAERADADAWSGLRVSSMPVADESGIEFVVEAESRTPPGYIVISGVEIDGEIIPHHSYNIAVGGTAVAANRSVDAANFPGVFTAEPYSTFAFMVGGTTPTPTPPTQTPAPPSPPPTVTPSPPGTILYGDADGNGIIDIRDVTLLRLYLVGRVDQLGSQN